MHELLIGFLIVAIVAIQIYVFYITLEKIKIFKDILPSQENFKTVKVYIKESEIETISLIDIFKNLHNYCDKDRKKNDTNQNSIIEEAIEINDEYSKYESFSDSDEYEYVEKNGIQTKIKSKNLDFFISKGWKVID